MEPVPENWSVTFCWPPYDHPEAQWYVMSFKEHRQVLAWWKRDNLKGTPPTHAEFLEYTEDITERQRFGHGIIHMRLL